MRGSEAQTTDGTNKVSHKECEADRQWLFKLISTSQVNLAWISERFAQTEKDLRILSRELRDLERLESEESA